MSNEKKPANAAKTEKKETELVTVRLQRATGNEEQYQFVGLNGKGYRIKRGVAVKVPKAVAAILAESERQKNRSAVFIEEQKQNLPQK